MPHLESSADSPRTGHESESPRPVGDNEAGTCTCPRQGRRRVRRGWVREAILSLLAERPRHGYDLITELAARVGGTWRPSPGSVYPALAALEDEGLIVGVEDRGKRAYRLTTLGSTLVDAPDRPSPWTLAPLPSCVAGCAGTASLRGPAGGAPPADPPPLGSALTHLVTAVEQVEALGTPDQLGRTSAILDRARRAVYAVLAEDHLAAVDPAQPAHPEPIRRQLP